MSTFDLISTNFHWLRPLWLLALIPGILLGLALWQQRKSAGQWQQVIAPELLPFLVDGETTRAHRWQIWAVIFAWIIASLALAGPTWEKRPMPVQKNQDALVLIFDLSPSMLTEDIKPSRLVRARLKIADVLREREDGLTALIAYAGDAHVVTPLTDDTATINSLLTSLHPSIMPLPGSNTEAAIDRALQLLKDAGMPRGDMLLITDGVVSAAHAAINRRLDHNFRLSILGVGSDTPVPIPAAKGGFMRDNRGAIVTTQLQADELKQLARENGGRYANLSSDNRDIAYLLSLPSPFDEAHRKVEREFDSWYESGHWLVFLLLPIVLYCFRRGVLVVLLLAPTVALYSQESAAFSWQDLWLTEDQQGQRALAEGDAARAAETFAAPEWKGTALYRAGDYAAAAEQFAQSDTARAHYNRGNALGKAGKLQDAIKAYDQALQRDPEFADAAANKKLLEDLLKQQQQQQQQDQENQDQQDQEQNKDESAEKKKPDNQQGEGEQQAGENSSAGDQQQQSPEQQEQQEQEQQKQANQGTQNSSASEAETEAEKEQQQSGQEAEQEAAAQQSSAAGDQQEQAMQAAMDENPLTDEEKQSLEQWLRRVPDDPGGLLRNKFRYQYQQEREQRYRDAWPSADQDDERW